jgi:hypothetical protein
MVSQTRRSVFLNEDQVECHRKVIPHYCHIIPYFGPHIPSVNSLDSKFCSLPIRSLNFRVSLVSCFFGLGPRCKFISMMKVWLFGLHCHNFVDDGTRYLASLSNRLTYALGNVFGSLLVSRAFY